MAVPVATSNRSKRAQASSSRLPVGSSEMSAIGSMANIVVS